MVRMQIIRDFQPNAIPPGSVVFKMAAEDFRQMRGDERGAAETFSQPKTSPCVACWRGHKEWVTEVNFLGMVEHRNLVKLVGYCAEDDERGRRSMDRNRPKSEQKLLEWVKPYASDSKKLCLVIDPRLEGQYSLKSAQRLASLANSCLVKHPRNRPKMSEVVETLKQIVEAVEVGSPQSTFHCQTSETNTEILTETEPAKETVKLI
ncbi:hypothetical protein SUGI_0816570 [Cryptomeria japonica]|nr:hypothetical protein SUGI_0816570 [Cryptomeria japonica]